MKNYKYSKYGYTYLITPTRQNQGLPNFTYKFNE